MKFAVCLSMAGLAWMAFAVTTVSDVLAAQRWPWSEKVDVDFTLTGDTADVDVTATWDGQSEPVLLGTVFAATAGVNRVTWDPAASPWAGVTLTGFSVTATPASAAAHTYLVVDLADGGVSYRATPDGNDGRWSDAYKTSKMVFRRIPAGTYQLGTASNLIAKAYGRAIGSEYATAWAPHVATFTGDFYVSVFHLTNAQYDRLGGTSGAKEDEAHYPHRLSYDEIRGSIDEAVNWPTSRYAVATDSLVDRLRRKARLTHGVIDLCAECQWETAMRAGTETMYPNGGTFEDSLSTLTNLVDEIASRANNAKVDVGLKEPNAWGVYDPIGLVPDWTLDAVANFAGTGTLPKKSAPGGTDPAGAKITSPTRRVIRGSGGTSLMYMLPCVRQVITHETAVTAGARFCIHLKPLAFPE